MTDNNSSEQEIDIFEMPLHAAIAYCYTFIYEKKLANPKCDITELLSDSELRILNGMVTRLNMQIVETVKDLQKKIDEVTGLNQTIKRLQKQRDDFEDCLGFKGE